MMASLFWLLILVQAPLPGLAVQEASVFPVEDSWQEFRSRKGNFKVLAPGIFKEKVDTINTYVGPLAFHSFFYQPPEQEPDNLVYLISYCDYPKGTIHSDSTELLPEFFSETLDAAALSVDGELLYSDDIKLRRYPGKIWRIDYLEGKAIIKTRAYLVGRRYFSLQTVCYKEKSLNTSSDKFLDSFRLLEKGD